MTEINQLTEHLAANVTDADRIPIWVSTGSAPFTRYVTRASLLTDVAMRDGDFDFGISEISDLTALVATLNQATITTSLAFDSASTIETVIHATPELTTSDILTGASQTVTATMTGATTDDHVQISFAGALADGITAQAWISAADTLSVKFHNTTAGTVSAFTINAKAHLFRFS